jgi:mono/diheme cytochrome c family protein
MNKLALLLSMWMLVALALSAACGPGLKGAIPTAGPTPAPTTRGDAAKGKMLFAGTCASCHGPDAKGLPNLGKNLVTSTFAKGLSDAELVRFVTKGRPATDAANTTGVDMPPRGGNPALKDKDLYDIVAYIRTLEK